MNSYTGEIEQIRQRQRKEFLRREHQARRGGGGVIKVTGLSNSIKNKITGHTAVDEMVYNVLTYELKIELTQLTQLTSNEHSCNI